MLATAVVLTASVPPCRSAYIGTNSSNFNSSANLTGDQISVYSTLDYTSWTSASWGNLNYDQSIGGGTRYFRTGAVIAPTNPGAGNTKIVYARTGTSLNERSRSFYANMGTFVSLLGLPEGRASNTYTFSISELPPAAQYTICMTGSMDLNGLDNYVGSLTFDTMMNLSQNGNVHQANYANTTSVSIKCQTLTPSWIIDLGGESANVNRGTAAVPYVNGQIVAQMMWPIAVKRTLGTTAYDAPTIKVTTAQCNLKGYNPSYTVAGNIFTANVEWTGGAGGALSCTYVASVLLP
jgi:hypothetical protein